MKIYTKSIEEYATDVIAMEERATCRFSEQSTIDSHIEIVKSNAKRLVRALAELEDDTTALQDYYIQKAVYIGERRGNEDCKVLSDRITDIRIEQRRKEREEMERREDMELLEDILTAKVEDLCEEDVEDMYELVEKYGEHMTEDQHARFEDIHMTLAEIAEDEEIAFANELYNQMLEEERQMFHDYIESDEYHESIQQKIDEQFGNDENRKRIVIEDVVVTGSLYIPCNRCDGKGIIDQYHYICFGRCFKCDGKGRL